MLNQFFAAITAADKLLEQFVGVKFGARTNNDRFKSGGIWAKFLQQCSHRADDHARSVGATHAPQHFHTSTHGFDAWAHTLERQCLPRRKQQCILCAQKLHEIVVQLLCARAGGGCNNQCCFGCTSTQCADDQCACIFCHGEHRIFATNFAKCWLVCCNDEEIRKLHENESGIQRGLTRVDLLHGGLRALFDNQNNCFCCSYHCDVEHLALILWHSRQNMIGAFFF